MGKENKAEYSDMELVERFNKGDRAAFEALVIRHQRRVYNLAYRITGIAEEAQELAQEVFIKVFQKLSTFRGESAFTTWLYQVTANHAKNKLKYLNRRKYFTSESIDEPIQGQNGPMSKQYENPSPRPDQALNSSQVQKIVQEKLSELEEDQRIVVTLRDIEGLDYDEIAEITGLALGTVKSRIHRGRLELKRKLAFLIREYEK